MLKWYEETGEQKDIVISSRVRLARNYENYPFSATLKNDQAQILVNEIMKETVKVKQSEHAYLFSEMDKLSEIEKYAMMERHLISRTMVQKKQKCAVAISPNESISIMMNDDDHIRIQSIQSGLSLDNAYGQVAELEDWLGESFAYAFDEKYGYLTSRVTDIGTGMRASCILFLPALTGAGGIIRLSEEVAKYGISMKPLNIEGALGTSFLYLVSNQKTLGVTENDILINLKNIVLQIIKQERKRREYILTNNYDELEDQVYRSYGVLKYTKQISTKDAMTLLAQVKFGLDTKIIEFDNSKQPDELENDNNAIDTLNTSDIYAIMVNIQAYNMQCRNGKYAGSKLRDKNRAEYLNYTLPKLKQS